MKNSEDIVYLVSKASSRLVLLAWLLFVSYLFWVAITQYTLTPAYPADTNFESWLKTSLEHATVYNGTPRTLYFYMDSDAWNSGKEDWQRGALKRLGCAAVLEFPEDTIKPPYHTELYISAPLPGGAPDLFASLTITDGKECTDKEMRPVTSIRNSKKHSTYAAHVSRFLLRIMYDTNT